MSEVAADILEKRMSTTLAEQQSIHRTEARVSVPAVDTKEKRMVSGESRNPFIRVFSSISLGIIFMCLILAYACIASALPQVRGALEMTEMQIFRHWIFAALITLFCVSLTTVTLTKIRWSIANAGVWIVHLGLLLLAGGSFWYFSTKLEGDVILLSPRVEILSTAAGNQRVLGKALAEKGGSWSSFMPAFGGDVRCDVIGTSQDKAEIQFKSGTGQPTTVTLSANGAATPLGDGRLAARYSTFPPATKFYDDHHAALYVRPVGSHEAVEFELPGLPLHRERYLDEGYVLQDMDGNPVPSKREKPQIQLGNILFPTSIFEGWNLPIQPREADRTQLRAESLPFDVEVTGYVPYIADMRAMAAGGGPRENPAVIVGLSMGGQSIQQSLFAHDPAKSMISGPLPIEFRWVTSKAEADQLLATPIGADELFVEIKDPPFSKTFAIQTGQNIKVDGTPYELTVKEIRPSWPMMTPGFEGASSPMASVDVKSADKSFNRTVIQRFPQLSQDIDEKGVRHREGPYDPNLVLRYRSGGAGWITIVAGPDIEPIAGIFTDDGQLTRIPLKGDQDHEFAVRGVKLGLKLEEFFRNSSVIEQPVIEPLERRRPNIAARSMSSIRLKFTGRGEHAKWSETRWCMFSQYPDVDARSLTIKMPGDSTEYEVIYSRLAHDLGATLNAGKLGVKFFPGRQSVESWRSDFQYTLNGESPQSAAVYTNQTCNIGPLTLFQSGAAADHWSYTILGVGNRNGIWPMVLGCVLITIGCLYAFYLKPVLRRKKSNRIFETLQNLNSASVAALVLALTFFAVPAQSASAADPFVASTGAAELDKQIDWSAAKLIAVQDGGRYKTLDSFARESLSEMYGHESFPGLSPEASLMEWLFRKDAYQDTPLIRIKDRGVQIHLTAHMPEAAMRRIRESGYMTPREFDDPVVKQRIEELEPKSTMVNAMRRVRGAEEVMRFADQMIRIVPDPEGGPDAAWQTPGDLKDQLSGTGQRNRSANLSPEQNLAVLAPWAGLWKAWNNRDAAAVQKNLDRLASTLPSLAKTGVYPSQSQRSAEARYYAWGKFTWGFWVYFLGGLIGIWALITRWKTPWRISLALLIVAMGIHATGLALRWYILGRIPVANMFEALTASAWIGIAIALVVELTYRTRFFLVAAQFTGFFALLIAGYVVPGGGTLTFIMGILDDIMLRIHTVLIISSYSLIFLASVIAVIYLFGYYFHTAARQSGEVGLIFAASGAALLLLARYAFASDPLAADGMSKIASVEKICGISTAIFALILMLQVHFKVAGRSMAYSVGMLLTAGSLAIGNHVFTQYAAWTLIGGGLIWAICNVAGILIQNRSGGTQLALAGGGSMMVTRPILAGAMPGDESSSNLPKWLQYADWSHLIILNMMFIMLFVGVILGAVWADYSWGRPWGWDPKEVFAMNTWIVYAILIHVRFIVKSKGLWTAWLSVAGCAMMAFNWCFVNFYIVGLHSYA